MLYKFKSRATSDLLMLEVHGRQILTLIGKGDTNDLRQGILSPRDMPAAISDIAHAVAREEEARKADALASEDSDDLQQQVATVSLRQRAAPFIEMIQRSYADDTPIVWGV
ncbi:MAG: hypothetical protein CFE44_08835 [Burkholderiales bacterium PBB4]|nr:MAG: hypothetical protein CFE44_08835 [Burkholderiales bacterium PBB4]